MAQSAPRFSLAGLDGVGAARTFHGRLAPPAPMPGTWAELVLTTSAGHAPRMIRLATIAWRPEPELVERVHHVETCKKMDQASVKMPGSSFSPRSTILSAPSGSGRCSACASFHGAVSQVSHSWGSVRIAGIAFG